MARKRRVGRPLVRRVLTKQGYARRARKHLGTECAICLTTQALVVHHLDHNNRHNTVDNLVTWCARCHDAYHHAARKEKRDTFGRMT